MPKSPGTEDGSDSNRLKISTKLYLWPHLATSQTTPMKRTVRSLFSVLLLLIFAAIIICRTLFRRSLNSVEFQLDTTATTTTTITTIVPLQTQQLDMVVFNETLLNFAAIDLSEEKLKQEISQLLDGDFDSLGRYKAFTSWRRFNQRNIRARTSNGASLSNRSPNFYRQWLAFRRVLHDWSRNKRYQPEIMSELIRLVKNPIDKYNGIISSDKRYSSCAVVGNSGILLNSNYGEIIDEHEAVIRLNNARIESYERKVGSKTSISFVNSNILHLCARRDGCFCHPYGESVPIVMYICQALHLLDYTVCNSSHKSPLIVTDARFDVLLARIVKYYSLKQFVEKKGKPLENWGSEHDSLFFHYSSGMQAVMLALGICDKVSIFGFGKSDLAKHHYHTNQKEELHLHDYEAEYEFYHDLVERPEVIPFIPRTFKLPPVVVYQ